MIIRPSHRVARPTDLFASLADHMPQVRGGSRTDKIARPEQLGGAGQTAARHRARPARLPRGGPATRSPSAWTRTVNGACRSLSRVSPSVARGRSAPCLIVHPSELAWCSLCVRVEPDDRGPVVRRRRPTGPRYGRSRGPTDFHRRLTSRIRPHPHDLLRAVWGLIVTLLRHSAAGFAALTLEGMIGVRLAEQMRHHTGRSPAPTEIRSWERSLPVLAHDLIQAGLDKVEVLVEHHLPLTSKRADVVLAGRHPQTREPSYVVIELKQWSSAEPFEDNPELVLIEGYPRDPRLHPVAQVRGYCDYLIDFTKSLEDLVDSVAGVAYLHNATREDAVATLRDYPQDTHGRLFTGATRSEFMAFLRERLDPDVDGAPYADQLINSAIAPSRQLLAVAAEEVQRREQFVLVAEQKLAYESVLHEVRQAGKRDTKTVIVVTGGPGSGKSVIALSLLGELARRGHTVLHATGSKSFTTTLRKVAGARAPRVQRMFKYFNSFMDAERNSIEVLILDEAHRLRETSENRYTRAEHRTGRPQLDELIGAARVPVFLLDEHQVVRPGELGTVADIKAYAAQLGLTVRQIDLDAQFRCGGSEEYIQWVLRLVGLSAEPLGEWMGDPQFDLVVADSPEEMESLLSSKIDGGYAARMAAGYCWPWSTPRPDGSLVPDVVIDGWSRPWNLRSDRGIGDAPPSPLWATDPRGFAQVGCVYTAQGFEYDWNGVIIGPDLVWRNGRFISVRAANKDPDFRSRDRVSDLEFDQLVRNVYKVLLTRGMVGTVVYSTDAETRDALRSLVQSGALVRIQEAPA